MVEHLYSLSNVSNDVVLEISLLTTVRTVVYKKVQHKNGADFFKVINIKLRFKIIELFKNNSNIELSIKIYKILC